MTRAAIRSAIQKSLQDLGKGLSRAQRGDRLSTSATELLNTLGCFSDRSFELSPSTFEGFYSAFCTSS